MFINMRQCFAEKQLFVAKWSIFHEGGWNFQETCILVILKCFMFTKVEKSPLVRENGKKVTLLLIYLISGI